MPIQKEIYRVAVQSTARAWRNRFERYALIGSSCAQCGETYYPKRQVCPACRTRDMKDVPLSHHGTVVSFTVNYLALTGYIEKVPAVHAMIQLDEGPCVFSEIVDCETEAVDVGMKLEMVVRRVKRESNGNLQYAHKWRPATQRVFSNK